MPAERIALARQQQVRAPRSARALEAGVGPDRPRLLRGDRPASRTSPSERGVRASVLVRVTVGVEAHTHEFIATAHEDQKFGFPLAEGAAAEAVRRVLKLDALELRRAALPHRLADLRHRRVRGRRAPGGRACWPRSGTSTASSCPSSTSAAASASPTRPTTTRATPHEIAKALREIVARECEAARAAGAADLPSSRAAPSSGPTAFTLYEVGTVKRARRACAPTSPSTAA